MTTVEAVAGTKVAPCRRSPRLWDSFDLVERTAARQMCGECAFSTQAACRDIAATTKGSGTYGGVLYVDGRQIVPKAGTC